jgi:hypothetical protein
MSNKVLVREKRGSNFTGNEIQTLVASAKKMSCYQSKTNLASIVAAVKKMALQTIS